MWKLTFDAGTGRRFDPTQPEVLWLCRQNMVWDDGPMPRNCTDEAPHPDIGSGRCGWSLIFPEVSDGGSET